MMALKCFFVSCTCMCLGAASFASTSIYAGETENKDRVIATCKGEARRPKFKPRELEATIIQSADDGEAFFEVTIKGKFDSWIPLEALRTRTGDAVGRIIFPDQDQNERFIYDATNIHSNPYAIWNSPQGWRQDWFLCTNAN